LFIGTLEHFAPRAFGAKPDTQVAGNRLLVEIEDRELRAVHAQVCKGNAKGSLHEGSASTFASMGWIDHDPRHANAAVERIGTMKFNVADDDSIIHGFVKQATPLSPLTHVCFHLRPGEWPHKT
jgi:hypothetical protein